MEMPALITSNLPVLVVIVPLFGGLLSLFTRRTGSWAWATLVAFATFGLAVLLLDQVNDSENGVVEYFLGGWPAQYGIGYRVDTLNAYIILVVSLIGAVVTMYAHHSVADEIPDDRHHFFYSVWLLALAGLLGIPATGDTFNIYVLLEISSLTVYALVAMGHYRDRRALTASLKYLILGSIGATFILLGIGYLLMLTGTLNMADMRDQLMSMKAVGTLAGNRTILVAFALLMVGLSLKMALFPLHTWLPNAYTYAPSAVTAFIAATATKVGVYMAFRFIFTIFGGVYETSATALNMLVLTVCACLGIVISSIAAIRQTNVKRILAYSSVGQLAYIVLGFSLVNQIGITASVIHIFNHAIIKGGMFMAMGCVALRMGGVTLDHVAGLGRRMPVTMAAFTVGGLGLIGVPMTSGFISKWYLVNAAIQEGLWWVAGVVLLGGMLALVYVWRVVEIIYFREPTSDAPVREAPLGMLIPTWLLIGASIYFGINADFTATIAETAAQLLMRGMT